MAPSAEPRSTLFRVRSVRFGIGTATAAALFTTASFALSDLGFDGPAVLAGEYWRLATTHLTHLDIRHAVTNAVGAGLVAAILLEFHRFATVFGCAVAIAAVISAASLVFFGESSYAGFSGILYGLAAIAVIRLARLRPGSPPPSRSSWSPESSRRSPIGVGHGRRTSPSTPTFSGSRPVR